MEFEISFDLQAGDRSEQFKFLVNPVQEMSRAFPNFPKEKFLRALKTHTEENKYTLYSGRLADLKFKNTTDLHEDQEIHILMLVMEKIGPISLIFRQTFEFLVLEGIDSHYNYIGTDALLNLLIQIIKPDSPTVKGLGKIVTIYHASNIVELSKKEAFVSFLDTSEGMVIAFSLSIILPTLYIIVLPLSFLDTMWGYLISLGVLAVLWNIYPLAKRSTRHAPLAVVSALSSYLLIEIMIHYKFLLGGINPWGIFNNISRQNLVGILKNQDIISDFGYELFFGMELLQTIIPFFDSIFIIVIPFTVGVGLAGLVEEFDLKWKSRLVLKTFFLALLLIFILIIPLGYHAVAKGTEGTLHTSIGLINTYKLFSPDYIANLEKNYPKLLQLIESAQDHLGKASNSFIQFGENPLIAYVLPYLVPEVAGIPLANLGEILTLTDVLNDSLQYVPNVLWAYFNLEQGFTQTFNVLKQSIGKIGGGGAHVSAEYNISMLGALKAMQLGVNNLTKVENPLLNLISEVEERLDYPVFTEISDLMAELRIGLPILITALSSAIPWINSTYKMTLVLSDLYDLNFFPEILEDAEKDFNESMTIQDIDVESIPAVTTLPLRELVNFSLNLHQVSQYYLYTVQNGTGLFQELNSTLSLIQQIDFSNASNIQEPLWLEIDRSLINTSIYLEDTKTSLGQMRDLIESQEVTFEQLQVLNQFLVDLDVFTSEAYDRIIITEQYFDALNGTCQSVQAFSIGSNNLNQTLEAILQNSTTHDNFTNAEGNFSLCQSSAVSANESLTAVYGQELLNESIIENWQKLLIGNVSDVNTNSIYMNAQKCLDLIDTLREASYFELPGHLLEFKNILLQMELLDDKWNIFTL